MDWVVGVTSFLPSRASTWVAVYRLIRAFCCLKMTWAFHRSWRWCLLSFEHRKLTQVPPRAHMCAQGWQCLWRFWATGCCDRTHCWSWAWSHIWSLQSAEFWLFQLADVTSVLYRSLSVFSWLAWSWNMAIPQVFAFREDATKLEAIFKWCQSKCLCYHECLYHLYLTKVLKFYL